MEKKNEHTQIMNRSVAFTDFVVLRKRTESVQTDMTLNPILKSVETQTTTSSTIASRGLKERRNVDDTKQKQRRE